MDKKNLPTLAELHHSPAEAFKTDQLNLLLNQPPHASWIKGHPMVKVKNAQNQSVPLQYMPIDKVEYLLTRIFQEWRVEVLQAIPMFQSIAVTIRLHYKNPVTGEWSFHDGVGAKSVQVNAGGAASDLAQIKDAAVMMALPSAKSYAIKDAAEHLGTLFGKDLNRKDTVSFRATYEAPEELEVKTTEPVSFDFNKNPVTVTTYVKQEEEIIQPAPRLAEQFAAGAPLKALAPNFPKGTPELPKPKPEEKTLNYFQSIGRGFAKAEDEDDFEL